MPFVVADSLRLRGTELKGLLHVGMVQAVVVSRERILVQAGVGGTDGGNRRHRRVYR